ncbi:unnamed protein product [Trichogramma brassicae]|uniref:Uncharacterized protein n=1 Tax=Trichogramma brassicae TaxID=86971 RepID=A0A6H5HXV5_9HYME|nr:unnamed protein product [Trichogramma brassicae]
MVQPPIFDPQLSHVSNSTLRRLHTCLRRSPLRIPTCRRARAARAVTWYGTRERPQWPPATMVATRSHENSELDASMTRRLRLRRSPIAQRHTPLP